MKRKEWAIGIDIGGTNVKTGLMNRQGKIMDLRTFPTPRGGDGALHLADLAEQAVAPWRQTLSWNEVAGIGVGIPGILNEHRTVVKYAVNLGMKDVPLASLLQESWGLPVTLDSDVIMGALGELHSRNDRKEDRLLYISIGTGIGACLYENGGIYRNTFGGPLNIGHMSIYPDGIACSCGNQGCLERYISATGLTERYAEAGEGSPASVESICQRAAQGEQLALNVLESAGKALGVAMVNLAQVFGSCPIIVGGGLSRIATCLETAKRVYLERGRSILSTIPVIRAAASPDYAGVMGAASAVLRN